MQMEQWQDAATRQVELLTRRLDELLSGGLELLRSELGVDLGLEPGLVPPWVIPLAACIGLVLMVCLWASVCRGLFKKRPALSAEDDDDDEDEEVVGGGTEVNRGVGKPVRPEEPKKKKKKAEKKAQPNGRAAAEPHEGALVSEETVPHQQQQPPQVKTDKVTEVKKSKKKAKQAVKESKTATAGGKEPEEGTWETKVSNKEKREQRKKDKGSSDGSASPGGGDTPVSHPPEQPRASAAPAPANQKKKKGESTKVKAEKVEPVVAQVNSREVAAAAAATAVVTDAPSVNVPARSVSPKTSPWTTSREPASLWRGDIDESWTVIDRAVPTSEINPSFTGLGVGAAAAEPRPVSDLPRLSQPRVDDEWSGSNGGSGDPSSDWNAPSEVWGNYEEPALEPAAEPEQSLPEPVKDDDEDEKGEASPDGAKTKKKKKKKKKAAEEGGATDQGEEPEKEATPAAPAKKQENAAAIQPVKAAEAKVERPMKDNKTSPKPAVTQVPTDGESTAKQNSLPAPAPQKKSEESQAPKPAKKKKARRET